MPGVTAQRVTVLGGHGFIGKAVTSALNAIDGEVDVHTMVRNASAVPADRTTHIGDVTDVASIRSAIRGSRTVVHAATYIGSDAELCRSTNVVGTENVLAACAAEGIQRLLYMSTAAVYGTGPHLSAREHDLGRSPESVLSRSRAAAEDIVFAAGGVAVRPDLIVGAGDRWFVPGLVKFIDDLGGLVDGGETLVSAIHVDDIGTIVARLAVVDREIPAGPLNAAYTTPVSISGVASMVAPATSWALPLPSIPRRDAAARARELGYSDRQFALLASDHWYDSTALRSIVAVSDVDGLALLPSDIGWYHGHLVR